MRYSLFKSIAGAVCLALVVVLCGPVQAAVPTNDTFEAAYGWSNGDSLQSASGWTASSADVVVTNTQYRGALSAYVPQDEALTNACGGSETKVWNDFYVYPNFFDGDATNREVENANATVLFFISSNGYPVVHDGASLSNWVVTTTSQSVEGPGMSSPLTADEWVRFSVFQDYSAKNWGLFVEGVLVAEEIGFLNQSQATFAEFSIEDDAYLDDWYVSVDMPTGNGALTGDSDGDGFYDVFELHYFNNTSSNDNPDADSDGDDWTDGEEQNYGTDPTSSGSKPSSIMLPYADAFEFRYSNGEEVEGTHGWSGPGTATTVNAYLGSGKSLLLGDGIVGLTNVVSGEDYTNIWVDLVIRGGHHGWGVDPNSNAAVAVAVNTDGYLSGYNGSTLNVISNYISGQITNNFATVSDDQWTRMIINMDYEADTFSVWFNDDAVNNQFCELAAKDYVFLSNATEFAWLKFDSTDTDGTAYVDNVSIALTMPVDVVDTDGDAVPDDFESDYGMDPEVPGGDQDGQGALDLLDYAFGTTNLSGLGGHIAQADLNTGNDVRVQVNVGANRTFLIYRSSNPDMSGASLLGSYDSDATQSMIDSGVLAGSGPFFYQAGASAGGSTQMSDVVHAIYLQDRSDQNTYYPVSVPVRYATGENTLSGELGRQLARGLVPAQDDVRTLDPDTGWTQHDLSSATNWSPDATIDVGQGVFVHRTSGTGTRTVFAGGRLPLSSNQVAIATGWQMYGWPIATGQAESADGWGFRASGASATNSSATWASEADQMWMLDGDGYWRAYRLLDGYGNATYDEHWYRFAGAGGNFPSDDMQAGEAVFYRHVGGGFTHVAD